MMNIPIKTCLISLLFLMSASAFAYNTNTHSDISEKAVLESQLQLDTSLLKDLGINPTQEFKNSAGKNGSFLETIRSGAVLEDDQPRPLNHFFNPVNGAPLSLGGMSLGVNSTSPDWILEDKGDQSLFGDQKYSYKDARAYFYDALTKSTKADREKNFGLMFESLGHVMHHIQDMAQPQHVRNDQHLELDSGKYEIALCLISINTCAAYFGVKNPSLYEKLSSSMTLPFTGYAPVYPNPNDVTAFSLPRKFWTDDQIKLRGLADFTNANFVSAGTNFEKTGMFSSPSFNPANVTTMVLNKYCADGTTTCKNPLSGSMHFHGTNVVDGNNNAESKPNTRTSSYSFFDSDLTKQGMSGAFALNRFTFEEAHKFLIPRAVAYSAGLINYFFRGKMEISLPDEGVYGIVDHAVESLSGISGFRVIKLKLKNVTPLGAGIEPMAATGKLVVIAKFHLNNCYLPDLSGEYGAPGKDWNTCRSKDEEIVISDPIDAPIEINTEAKSLRFTFTKNPIPINASDLFLQVVYRGPLGEETDAVVVATKDISEPQYTVFSADQEQYTWPGIMGGSAYGQYTWRQSYCDLPQPPITYEPDCKYLYRESQFIRFTPQLDSDPDNPIGVFNATATILDLPVSSYARIAVLRDVNIPLFAYRLFQKYIGATEVTGPDVMGGNIASTNQLDSVTKQLIPTPYFFARGIYIKGAGPLPGDVPAPPLLVPVLPSKVTISPQFLVP